MAEHPNVEAVRAGLEAFMKGDMETMSSNMADDVVWHIPGKHEWAGDYRGKAEVVGRFQRMAQAGVTSSIDEIHDIVGNDEHVVALVKLTITRAGKSVTTNSVQVYHVKDGKAIEFWATNDRLDEIEALLKS